MNIAENSKYLNWKCIDNFEKVSDNKIFYNCKDITLSERQRVICKEEFGKIKSKFGPILSEFVEEARGKKKTHLKIAGGNYTFFFTLPKIVEWIRSQFPFLGIEINLFERSGKEEGDKDLDFILTSESKTIPSTALEKLGYYKTRQKIWDGMFFASSEESVKNFKGKENVLKNQDILFGRIYATETSKEQNKKIYLPQGRRNFTPRVIVDQFFLEYLLLQNSAGMAGLHTTMTLSKNIVKISDQLIEELERIVVIKKNLKEYKSISRRLLNILKYREG